MTRTVKSVFLVLVFCMSSSGLLAQPSVSAQVYNPSCPGYYSVSLADVIVSYNLEEIMAKDSVAAVDLIYSVRNAWTQQSWFRSPTTVRASQQGDSGLYQASISGLEVAARGSYFASHVEFALRILSNDGKIIWDNGQRAPLGFYSAALPMLQCFRGPGEILPVEAMASATDYTP